VTAGPVRVATIGTVVAVVTELATFNVLDELEVVVDVVVSLEVDEVVVEVEIDVWVEDVVVGGS